MSDSTGFRSRPQPEQIGHIVTTRFLELSPKRFVEAVRHTDAQLARDSDPDLLDHIPGLLPPPDDLPTCRWDVTARFRPDGSEPFQVLRSEHLRLYRLEGDHSTPEELLRRMRLVNYRNLLTAAILDHLGNQQADFLRTGHRLRRLAFPQARLAEAIEADPRWPIAGDPGRISRLLKRIRALSPRAQILDLRELCPKPRDLTREYVAAILRRELAEGLNDPNWRPWSDREIAEMVTDLFGQTPLTRTVADIRRELGVPNSHKRRHQPGYLAATREFTVALPFTSGTVRRRVPETAGVYEIQKASVGEGDCCRVIYIGSARNLRKRLLDHIWRVSGNPCLNVHLDRSLLHFRMLRWNGNCRAQERRIYRAFAHSFGDQPVCNRMSP